MSKEDGLLIGVMAAWLVSVSLTQIFILIRFLKLRARVLQLNWRLDGMDWRTYREQDGGAVCSYHATPPPSHNKKP